jgi:methyl-accepting chemotaxis protein
LQEAVSYFTLMNQDSRNTYARAPKSTPVTQSRKKADKKVLSDDDLDKDFVRYS